MRYYTDQGLIPDVYRNEHNNRLFDEKSLGWLYNVKILRNCGLSIQSIREYVALCLIGDFTVPQRYQILLKQEASMAAQMEEFIHCSQVLSDKLLYYKQIMNGEVSDESNPDKWRGPII